MRRVDVVLHELFSHALDKFIDPNSVVVDPLLCGKSGLDMRVCVRCVRILPQLTGCAYIPASMSDVCRAR